MKALYLISGVALLGWGAQANAAIYIAFQESGVNAGAITTVADDGGTGQLGYVGSYGNFKNSVIVQGYPALSQPQLQTAAIDSSSSVGGTLTIYVTQTDLDPITGGLQSSFTANSFLGNVTSVTLSTWIDATNGQYAGTELAEQTFTAIGSQTYVNAIADLNGLFSETTKYVITFGDGGASANNTINIAAATVPEPASWTAMLLGFGFIGNALRRSKARVKLA